MPVEYKSPLEDLVTLPARLRFSRWRWWFLVYLALGIAAGGFVISQEVEKLLIPSSADRAAGTGRAGTGKQMSILTPLAGKQFAGLCLWLDW
jgi:hypothetical protein